MDILDEILLDIVLVRAASASGSSGITLLSDEAILGRIFGDIASADLLHRCAADLDMAEQNPQQSEALDELADQFYRSVDNNASVEQRLLAARETVHDLVAICLLASSRAVPHLDLVISNPAILDYIRRIDYRGEDGTRIILIGRLYSMDDDVLIGADPSIRALRKFAVRYSANTSWPLLTVAQGLIAPRIGGRPGIQDWPQSNNEIDDLELRDTNIKISTRTEHLPYRLPLARGTLNIVAQNQINMVVTRVTNTSNMVFATYLHIVDAELLSSSNKLLR